MAKIKSFTDNAGVTHANCYWRLTQIAVDTINESASFTFSGYADKQKRDSKKQPVVGASKQYYVSGEKFREYYTKHIEGELNLAEIGYAIAMDAKDVPSGFDTETGKQVNESFFKDAEDA